MGYVEGANASNLQCLEYLSQDKCLSSLHKGLCSEGCFPSPFDTQTDFTQRVHEP